MTEEMTPAEFRAIRQALGLSTRRLALLLEVSDGRTIRRWEAGERDIPGPAQVLMRWLSTNERPKLPD